MTHSNGIIVFGVHCPADLDAEFQEYCKRNHYPSRSEAIRALMRECVIQDQKQHGTTESKPRD